MIDHTAPKIQPIVPKPVTLSSEKTALLVLEMSEYCANPEYMCAPLVPGITNLLERARSAGVLIAYTIPLPWKGKPHGKVFSGFKRRFSETLFFFDGFDKFYDGRLQTLLCFHEIDTLILTGGKANMAVMHSGTTAAVFLHYNVVVPVDGIAATTEYEKEYALHHFRAYPDGSYNRFSYTLIDEIRFHTEG